MHKTILICSLLIICTFSAVPNFELKNAAVKGTLMPAVGLGTGGYGTKS